jgi:nitroimidazol reductase NimA-like FMN-containing flavoprotein (pyridoxamine 5'-phosphate oxidase superfamily)
VSTLTHHVADVRPDELAERARAIIDAGMYMTLATADAAGVPWASPVWYAPEDYTSLLWISSPQSRHSRNLAARAELSIVIFDSRAPIGVGEGVYFEVTAGLVGEREVEAAMALLSERSMRQGGVRYRADDVLAPAPHRLYRATASQVYFSQEDRRIPVNLR